MLFLEKTLISKLEHDALVLHVLLYTQYFVSLLSFHTN